MATQSNGGAVFSVSTAQQSFRLLELPPELLEILSSANPPTLSLKSPDSSDATNTSEAVLCTLNKTYQLRQVSTSNTVYITTPLALTSETDPIGELGISTISQCTSSLETVAVPPGSAMDTLIQMLVPFAEPEDITRSSSRHRDQEAIFANTPMSDYECRKAWIESLAFEMDASESLPRRSYRPTAGAALKAWSQICQLAASESDRICLAEPMGNNVLNNVLLNSDEDQGWPVELRKAVLMRLVPTQDVSQSDLDDDWPTQEEVSLNRDITVQWVGVTILQAHRESTAKSSRLKKTAFVDEWKDALPEKWREDAELDVLTSLYKFSVNGGFLDFAAADAMKATGEATETSGKPSTVATGKRKWHEKFAQARKQGKK